MKVFVILCVVVAAMAHPQGQVDPAFYQPGNGAGPQNIDPGYYQGGGASGTNGVNVVDNNPPSSVNVVNNAPYPQHLYPPTGVNVVNNAPYPQHLYPPTGGIIYNVDPFYYQGGQPGGQPPSVIHNVDPFYYQGGQPGGQPAGQPPSNVDIGPTFVNQGTWNRPQKYPGVHPGARGGQ